MSLDPHFLIYNFLNTYNLYHFDYGDFSLITYLSEVWTYRCVATLIKVWNVFATHLLKMLTYETLMKRLESRHFEKLSTLVFKNVFFDEINKLEASQPRGWQGSSWFLVQSIGHQGSDTSIPSSPGATHGDAEKAKVNWRLNFVTFNSDNC